MKTASGSGLGFGTPLRKRSHVAEHSFKWTCSGVSIEMDGGARHCTSGRTIGERLGLALIPEPSGKRGMVLQGFV